MIYELRVYHIAGGKEEDLLERFQNVTFPLFEKHGIKICDYWVDEEGKTLCYVCQFDDATVRQERWESFKTDKEWVAAKAKSEENGPLVDRQESYLLKRPDYIQPCW